MNFFLKLLNSFKKENSIKKSRITPQEVLNLLYTSNSLKKLLLEEKYIAKSDYMNIIENTSELQNYFNVIINGGLLHEYCSKNSVDKSEVLSALTNLANISDLIDRHNLEFLAKTKIKEKEYLDNILKKIDSDIILDNNQREVVLTDEDYSLVIAGAGAGKTTTVAAKVKYLVEKKYVDPKEILVISFTNKAVEELQGKINKDLSIPCPITTFHSAGNAILRKNSVKKLNIVDSSRLYFVLRDYFKGNLLKNERMVNNLILFFGSYFDAPYEGNDLNTFFNSVAKARYETLRSDLNEYIQEISDARSKRKVTISNEILRSKQEVEIANFLYLNNIDYQYEPIYPFNIQFSRKPYTPDFIISQGDSVAYIEHFGLSEAGENNRYSVDEIKQYKKTINDKVILHKKHGTKLIYTFSKYNDNRQLLEHLKESLEEAGFILKPRSNKEIVAKLVDDEQSRYINKLVNLVCRFIENFKTNAFTDEDFIRMSNSTKNVRSKIFLDICNQCYLEYQRYLSENNAVDFQDMINESARLLREVREMKQKLDFKYIIIDEYQDISRQRFDLTRELSIVTNAKIIAVGDDWQSIYAFSGSDITLFTKFIEKMGYGKLLKIVNTYRNAQEVIDIAGSFIQKNTQQIKKDLISPKKIVDPVIIYTYDSTFKSTKEGSRSGANYALAHAVETALGQIIAYNNEGNKNKVSKILLLGRFNFDGEKLERSGLFENIKRGNKVRSVKYPNLDITFMTTHSSKGLGYDNVIIINGRNETYGFPSKIEDDPVLNFVLKTDYSIEYAEERRLFYVAMTRTKNRVFIVAPEQNPSEFLLEIKKDYKNVVLRGKWKEGIYNNPYNKKCPICGYPLQFKYKNSYGLRLYICTNEPEICDFISNDLIGNKMSIQKCDKCVGGYLIIKKANKGLSLPFLGCTNYSRDGRGCNNHISMKSYYSMNGIHQEFEKFEKKNEKINIEPPKTTDNIQKIENLVLQDSFLEKEVIDDKKTSFDSNNLDKLDRIYYEGEDLLKILGKILKCAEEISLKHFFDINILLNVLRGVVNPKVKEYRLQETSLFGELNFLEWEELEFIVEWLISNDFLMQRKIKYPVIHLTYNGNNFLNVITNLHLKKLSRLLNDKFPGKKISVIDKITKKEKDYLFSAGKKWTEIEDVQLLKEYESGLQVSLIAKKHNRTYNAIRLRIIKLTEQDKEI